jgi:site-specific DNA-methyltransferase (adenine-specific)
MRIKLHGIRNNLVVMDPFLGTGSTAIASYRLDTSFIGFEIESMWMKQ